MPDNSVTAKFWVVIKAQRAAWNRALVNGARVSRTTVNKPDSIGKDEVLMRLEVTLPESLFTRPALQANITVPVGQVLSGDVIQAIAEAAPTLVITVRDEEAESDGDG